MSAGDGIHRPLEGRQTVERLYLVCEDGHPMVERVNSVNGSEWPKCARTRKLPEYLRLKRAGAAELPGFE